MYQLFRYSTTEKLKNHINRIYEKTLQIAYQELIQSLMNFLQKTVPSAIMNIVYRNYFLKYLELKWIRLPKSWMDLFTL